LAPSKRPLILKKIREERGELRVLQVATFGTEGTKSAILTACRGYRNENYPDGIDNDTAQYIASLIPQERGFLWSLDDVTKGNPEKDRKPIVTFNEEMKKYPGLLDIIYGIDGLVNKRSQHASGVILYNNDPWETDAVMRSPNGDLTTQFSLHAAEECGDTKFDFLVTEICDKLINAINLLKNDGYFTDCEKLRDIYNQYLHPDVINLKDEKIWDTLASGTVVDLFQFDSPVGGQAIKSILPRNPLQMMMANALTRLTGEKGEERPIEKYVRFKNNIQLWYRECNQWGLTEEEIKILEPYYLPVSGVPTTQEKLMLLCMEPKLANFSLKESNAARKICAKKQLDKIPELKEKFISQCPRRELGEYVWHSAIEPQMSYAFAEPHALAYSFIAIQILVLTTYYPIIYWNCACLITNSGGDEFIEDDDDDEDEDDDDEVEASDEEQEELGLKKKKKEKNTDYGKVATAIGNFQNRGIKIVPPDINSSAFTFSPDVKNNSIIYGLRGITRISNNTIHQIIDRRPYSSVQDFIAKNNPKKPQILNLIKAGAFDSVENKPREQILHDYIASIADKKERLTLQNMQMLITKELIPDEMAFYAKLFLFNKFLKTCKHEMNYKLNDAAINFISNNFDVDLTTNGTEISQKVWDNLYKKSMEPMRVYLKEHKDDMLDKLNQSLFNEVANKYMTGNISTWEMESINFYYHKHELDAFKNDFDDFFKLPETPEVDYSFVTRNGQEIVVYKIHNIIGTVIDKDKVRNTATLLTPTGVVTVRIYKNQFAIYDKQISARGEDGKKHVIEASWLKRGTLLRIQGIRRGDDFIPKKTKSSVYPIIMKIIDTSNGVLTYQQERMEVE
jgi:DNA polymerase-3 subunit alpha